jgi:hypothetical protein
MRRMIIAFTCQWLKVNRHTLRVCYVRDSELGPLSDPPPDKWRGLIVPFDVSPFCRIWTSSTESPKWFSLCIRYLQLPAFRQRWMWTHAWPTRSSTTRMKSSPVFKSRPVKHHILVSGLWRIQSWLKRGLRVSALQNDRAWRFIILVSSDDVSFELQLESDTAGRMGCTDMY